MADKPPVASPADEILTTLKNQIADLQKQLADEKAARESAPKFERKEFDDAIKALKDQIEELKKEKQAIEKQDKGAKKGDENEGGDEGSVASGIKSLSVFTME